MKLMAQFMNLWGPEPCPARTLCQTSYSWNVTYKSKLLGKSLCQLWAHLWWEILDHIPSLLDGRSWPESVFWANALSWTSMWRWRISVLHVDIPPFSVTNKVFFGPELYLEARVLSCGVCNWDPNTFLDISI